MGKKLLIGVILVIVLMASIEVGSFGAIYALSKTNDGRYLKPHVRAFHPAFGNTVASETRLITLRDLKPSKNPMDFDMRTGFAPEPGKKHRGKIRINADGFICNKECGRPLQPRQAHRKQTVFAIGGSYFAGTSWLNDGSETIVNYIEHLMNSPYYKSDVEWRIVNAGFQSYDSKRIVERLAFTVLPYKPDGLIVLLGHSDYREWTYAISNKERFNSKSGFQIDKFDTTMLEDIKRLNTISGSISHTINIANQYLPFFHYTVTLAKHVRRIIFDLGFESTQKKVAKSILDTKLGGSQLSNSLFTASHWSLRDTLDNIRTISGIAMANKIPTLICLHPNMMVAPPMVQNDRIKNELAALPENEPFVKTYQQTLRQEFARLAEELQGPRMKFCDLTTLMSRQTKTVAFNLTHQTPYGNKVVAKELVDRYPQPEKDDHRERRR